MREGRHFRAVWDTIPKNLRVLKLAGTLWTSCCHLGAILLANASEKLPLFLVAP